MKIAIMTQPLGKNYGGMMQAFALQKVLENMGHDVVTIDRQSAKHGTVHNCLRLIYRGMKKVIGNRKAPVNIERHYPLIFKNSHDFIENNIKLSERFFSTEKLKKHFLDNSYDAVIVGSDQTWRPKYSANIYNFYLDFLNNNNIKRIAYASSFGVDYWEYSEEETSKCSALAKSFDAISVRESSGVDLCEKYLGVKSESVLDPTLLLEKEDYLELIGDRYRDDDGEGVFTYWLDENEEKSRAAEYLAKQLETHTFRCQAKFALNNLVSKHPVDYQMPAVEDWLASFSNAKFVLTDSFHGVVFSILSGKPFYAILNKSRGAARFRSLLEKLELEDRLIEDTEMLFKLDLSKEFDSLKVEDKLKKFTELSLKFIVSNLK